MSKESFKQQRQQPNVIKLLQAQIQPMPIFSATNKLYKTFFQHIPLRNILDYKEQLTRNKITYSPNQFNQKYSISILGKTQCNRVLNLSVTLSYFNFQILVLNIEEESLSQYNLLEVSHGTQGHIYKNTEFYAQSFAVKSIRYRQQHSPFSESGSFNFIKLTNFINQYCIYKLCSVLKIGPYVKKYFDFDILIFQSKAQFTMQLCVNKKQLQKQQLKQSLKLLHSLRIIHGDIKPQNIMWSQTYKKWVFLDFGFSRVLNEQQASGMSYTSFFGSYYYSCPQMKQIYNKKGKNFVDLYYNDVYCLIQSFNEQKISDFLEQNVQAKKKQKNNKQLCSAKKRMNQNENCRIYWNFFFNVRLKKAIFDRDQKKVEYICGLYKNCFIANDTIQLLSQMKRSKKVVNILNYLLQKYLLSSQRIQQIIQYHSMKSLKINIEKQTKKKFQKRINQKLLQSSKFSYLDITKFLYFTNAQDISSCAIKSKQKNYSILTSSETAVRKQQNLKSFWYIFTNYINNLYTTKQQILKIFQIAKQMLQIKEWKVTNNTYLEIGQKALKIYQTLQQKKKFNLCQIAMVQKYNEKYRFARQNIFQDKVVSNIFIIFSSLKLSQTNQQTRNRIKQLQDIKCLLERQSTHENKLSELLILYMDILISQYNQGKQRLKQRYHIIQKLQYYQLPSKCKLTFETFIIESRQQTICRQYRQIINRFLIRQDSMYNYCFESSFILNYFFYTRMYLPFNAFYSIKDQEFNLSQLTQNLRNFIVLYDELRESDIRSLELIIKYWQYCAFSLNIETARKIKNVLIKQLFEYVKNNKQKLSYEQVLIILHINMLKPHTQTLLQRQFYITLLQLQRSKLQIQQDNVQKYKNLFICLIIKQIQFKRIYKIIGQEQKYLQLQKLNLNQGIVINRQQTCFCLIFNIVAAQILMENFDVQGTSKYIQIIYDQLQRQYKHKSILQYTFMLLLILAIYQRVKNGDFDRIFKTILKFIYLKRISKSKMLVPVQIYIVIQRLFDFVCPEENQQLIQMLIYKLTEIIPTDDGIKQFCQNYGQILIFCQQLLKFYLKFNAHLQKAKAIHLLKVMSLSKMFYNQCSSFIRSRFRSKICIVSQKFINFCGYKNKKQKKYCAVLRCLRDKQYCINQQQVEYLTKKILGKLLKTEEKEPIMKVYSKVQSSIAAINRNKNSIVQVKQSSITMYETHTRLNQLINQKQINSQEYQIEENQKQSQP